MTWTLNHETVFRGLCKTPRTNAAIAGILGTTAEEIVARKKGKRPFPCLEIPWAKELVAQKKKSEQQAWERKVGINVRE